MVEHFPFFRRSASFSYNFHTISTQFVKNSLKFRKKLKNSHSVKKVQKSQETFQQTRLEVIAGVPKSIALTGVQNRANESSGQESRRVRMNLIEIE